MKWDIGGGLLLGRMEDMDGCGLVRDDWMRERWVDLVRELYSEVWREEKGKKDFLFGEMRMRVIFWGDFGCGGGGGGGCGGGEFFFGIVGVLLEVGFVVDDGFGWVLLLFLLKKEMYM